MQVIPQDENEQQHKRETIPATTDATVADTATAPATTTSTRSRHKRLLEEPDVKRWYDNVARGSKTTADVRIRRLGVYCERTNTTPTKFAQLGINSVRDVEDLLMDYVSFLESKNYAPSYIEDILKALRSWLSFNYVQLMRRIKIKNADIPVTLEDEVIPTQEKLRDIFDAATIRGRVSISLMALAGVRPEVLGKYDSSDGLLLSDIKDLEIKSDGTDVSFTNMPARVVVRQNLSKAGHQYFTHLPELGCRFLQGYLRERIANGERLGAGSAAVTFLKGYQTKCPNRKNSQRTSPFLATNTITREIKDAFSGIIKERPYVLRSYFDTQLLLAESKGKITHAYRQFFMGHKGDMEAKYTTNKHKLPEHLIQDMREAYIRSQGFLVPGGDYEQGEAQVNEKNKKQLFLEMWQEQANMFGINPMDLTIKQKREDGNGADADNSEEDESIDEKINMLKNAILAKFNQSNSQQHLTSNSDSYTAEENLQQQQTCQSKIIDNEDELLSHITDGWQLVKELNNGKFVLSRQRKANRIVTLAKAD